MFLFRASLLRETRLLPLSEQGSTGHPPKSGIRFLKTAAYTQVNVGRFHIQSLYVRHKEYGTDTCSCKYLVAKI